MVGDSEVAVEELAMCKARRGDPFVPKDFYVRESTFFTDDVTEVTEEKKHVTFALRK